MADTTIFKWDAAKEKALWLLFDGKMSQAEVAENVGVATRTCERWVAHPVFKTRLEQMRVDLDASLKATLYVSKESRLIALAEMAQRARNEFEHKPLLKEVRPTKDGPITNEHFNEAAFAAFCRALDDIAKEKGERKNITELSGKDGKPIEISDTRQRLATKLRDLAERRRAGNASHQSE